MKVSRGPADERGFSLLELLIVSLVLAMLGTIIADTLARLSKAQGFQKGQARTEDVTDRTIRAIEGDASFAARVFTHGDWANDYLAGMDFDQSRLAVGSRLPALTSRGFFDKDASDKPETGNMLFMVCTDETKKVDLWDPRTEKRSILRLDTYYFSIHYLTATANGALDLARWGSVRVANHGDILHLDESRQRSALLLKLAKAGIRYAWAPLAERGRGLYKIEHTDDSAWLELLGRNEKLPASSKRVHAGVLGPRRLQVATNGSVPKVEVPFYARPGAAGFPGGFEVKVDGPVTGKLMMIRLVVASVRKGRARSWSSVQRFVSCRGG